MIAAVGLGQIRLFDRADSADDDRAQGVGPLGEDRTDPAGGGVDKDRLARFYRPCRVYAPVGGHEDLLAYLVRRLLENGANTSFINRIVDEPDLMREAHALAHRLDDSRSFETEHGRQANRIETGALIGIDEVEPDRFLPDEDLARLGRRARDVDRLQDFGPTRLAGLDGQHQSASSKKSRVRRQARWAAAAS